MFDRGLYSGVKFFSPYHKYKGVPMSRLSLLAKLLSRDQIEEESVDKRVRVALQAVMELQITGFPKIKNKGYGKIVMEGLNWGLQTGELVNVQITIDWRNWSRLMFVGLVKPQISMPYDHGFFKRLVRQFFVLKRQLKVSVK